MPDIIASVFAESVAQVARAGATAAMAGADWLELRLDRWPSDEDVAAAVAAVRLPVLVTCHTPENGGHFRGTLGERRELLTAALIAGAEGVDLDIDDRWMPPAGRTGLRRIVRSFHSFTGVPRELDAIHARLVEVPGAIAKIVVTAHDLADAAPVFELLRTIDQAVTPTVAFAMGRTAWPTRLLALAHGAPFVFGSLEGGAETAIGQLPVALLKGLYRAQTIGAGTRIFGLLGNPALQSLGPWVHNRAFRQLGLDSIYLPFETSRPDAVLDMLPPGRVGGVSVTAPHKAAMAERCSRWSEEAAAVEVVNTLVAVDDGAGWEGHNTDVAGVQRALAEVVSRPGGSADAGAAKPVAVVLGAGGAARAGAFAMLELGFEVTILGRSIDGVRAFAERHGIRLGSLSARLPDGLRPSVVVNATPLGSAGADRAPDERPLPDWVPEPGTVVFDMVYRPHETRLLRDAKAAGARIVHGLEMFLEQARSQVRSFTGRSVTTDELRRFVAGAI